MRLSEKVKGVFNVKSSTYYFHRKMKILADFQNCLSVCMCLCTLCLYKSPSYKCLFFIYLSCNLPLGLALLSHLGSLGGILTFFFSNPDILYTTIWEKPQTNQLRLIYIVYLCFICQQLATGCVYLFIRIKHDWLVDWIVR